MCELVSIVIPCHNAGKYVAEAIRSALDQTYANIEVVVVDDGSEDNSLEVLKSFGDSVRWVSGPNRGGCAARNTGIEMALGDWIQFLDADDVLAKDCVAKKIDSSASPDVIMVCKVAVLEGFQRSMLSTFWLRDSYDFDYMLRVGTPQTAQPIHRRENLLKIGGFNENLTCANEYDLHLRLSLMLGLRFKVIDIVGVYIRPLAGSLSRRSSERMSRSIAMTRLNAFKLICRDKNDPVVALKPYEDLLNSTARIIWQAGMKEDALWLHGIASRLSADWWKYGYGKRRLRPAIASVIGFKSYEKIISAISRRPAAR